MSDNAEIIDQRGTWAVIVRRGGSTLLCGVTNEADARRVRDALINAYDAGQRDKQREIRCALGLEDHP